MEVDLKMPESMPALTDFQKVTLYRVMQELINNALKYSEATKIAIDLRFDGRLSLSIKDNGRGFDVGKITESEGIGWKNIYSRVEMLSGIINISSRKGNGTQVNLEIPLDGEIEAATG